jgi:hypothetical protein
MRMIMFFLAAIVFSASVTAMSLEEDIQANIKIFNGDKSTHSAAAEKFRWIGLSDTRLFDVIEQRLITEDAKGVYDPHEISRLERYIRALGFSGQRKYQATLVNFKDQTNYRKAAEAALKDLPVYEKWNPIISNRSMFDPKYSDEANRIMNMLRSNDLFLNEIAAKRIYYEVKEDYLYEYLAEQVKVNYMRTEEAYRDVFSWQVKALSSSKNEKYRSLILEVAKKAVLPTIRRHAENGIERDYMPKKNGFDERDYTPQMGR